MSENSLNVSVQFVYFVHLTWSRDNITLQLLEHFLHTNEQSVILGIPVFCTVLIANAEVLHSLDLFNPRGMRLCCEQCNSSSLIWVRQIL